MEMKVYCVHQCKYEVEMEWIERKWLKLRFVSVGFNIEAQVKSIV